ncbi:hypothetical protein [Cryobacterium sp. Hb1]|uniref:hypothetical protein n=1 Tax=Cryobacterium sp. Hb1 TaxID=1259147 RepID=UPI00106AA4A8|nr:hypothetical protein [Cryobacterium sp. Hb1]TFD70102.1 hypothetical protein E3T38_06660 [Cryobacterium sp. Hb1]
MRFRKSIGLVLAAALWGSLLTVAGPLSTAQAANAQLFNPGNIISDAQFFDGGAMTAPEVQSFLNSQVATCRSGYACLKDYRQDTPNRAAVPGDCSAYTGRSAESAAGIITNVGAACGISQKAMLVLLQKEQGLVTDTWPTSRQYRSATGYGCPDTADCDSTYYGFFNQVYAAALQFNYYANNPSRWNHAPGRVNNVRWHPNAACGTGEVFIQNQATAGLYNYTPYQPNAAAMANLYGTGDACSSYGNRNFWRIFTDWFGAPLASTSLFRTADNATVYLVSGTSKFPIPSLGLMAAFAPLGQVGFVSQNYLDGFATKRSASRILRSPDGRIYFHDAGIKLPFDTCAQVVDYGGSCNADGYVQLTDTQLAAFQTGPLVVSVLATREGPRYFMTLGTKREILDAQSQVEAGIPLQQNVLTEAAVEALPFGTPIVRDSVLIKKRYTSDYALFANGTRSPIGTAYSAALGLQSRVAGSLHATSHSKLAPSGAEFNGLVKSDGDAGAWLLTANGRARWDAAAAQFGLPAASVSQSFLDSNVAGESIAAGALLQDPTSKVVHVLMGDEIRPISSWEALLALSDTTTPTIHPVTTSIIAAIPKGAVALTAGTLVRSPDNPSVFLVNGVTNRIALSSFDFTTEAGITGFTYEPAERINAYPLSSTNLTFGITCGDTRYVSSGGSLHKIAPAAHALYPFTFVALDEFTCNRLIIGSDATDFIRTPNGAIYQLVAGQKRPVTSMERFAQLSGGRSWLQVIPRFADMIPTGAVA